MLWGLILRIQRGKLRRRICIATDHMSRCYAICWLIVLTVTEYREHLEKVDYRDTIIMDGLNILLG